MTDDLDFQRDARQSNLTIHAANAAEVTTTLGKLLASPQPVIDRARAELRRLVPN